MEEEGDKVRMVLATCTRGGNDIHHELFNHFMCERDAMLKGGWDVNVIFGISNTAAFLAQEALFKAVYDDEADFMYHVDSDVVPINGTLQKLLDCKKDLVIAPIWHCDKKGMHLNVHRNDGVRLFIPKDSGVEKIVSASFGVMLVSRKVLGAFRNAQESPVKHSTMLEPILEGAESDNIFFWKLKLLGLKAYVCWDAKGATHFKRVALNDRLIETITKNIAVSGPEHIVKLLRAKGRG